MSRSTKVFVIADEQSCKNSGACPLLAFGLTRAGPEFVPPWSKRGSLFFSYQRELNSAE